MALCVVVERGYTGRFFSQTTQSSVLFQGAPKSGSEGQFPMCTFGCIHPCPDLCSGPISRDVGSIPDRDGALSCWGAPVLIHEYRE